MNGMVTNTLERSVHESNGHRSNVREGIARESSVKGTPNGASITAALPGTAAVGAVTNGRTAKEKQ